MAMSSAPCTALAAIAASTFRTLLLGLSST
jgi:hypothetical protein